MTTQLIIDDKNARLVAMKSANWVQHLRAWNTPRIGFESCIVRTVKALGEYAEAHFKAYDSRIAEDYVLGDAWLDMAKACLRLLDGETGRLDCGTIDSMVRAMAVAGGFTADLELS